MRVTIIFSSRNNLSNTDDNYHVFYRCLFSECIITVCLLIHKSKSKELGFIALSRIFHLYWADPSTEVGKKWWARRKPSEKLRCKTWHLTCTPREAWTTVWRIQWLSVGTLNHWTMEAILIITELCDNYFIVIKLETGGIFQNKEFIVCHKRRRQRWDEICMIKIHICSIIQQLTPESGRNGPLMK